jgi:hypothetical protein
MDCTLVSAAISKFCMVMTKQLTENRWLFEDAASKCQMLALPDDRRIEKQPILQSL